MNYIFGDIVLVKFPYTDNINSKKRPALVIKDTNDGDVIVCRVTSQFYSSVYDLELKDWKQCGLILPSIVRLHKLAAIEKDLIERKLGSVKGDVKVEVVEKIQLMFH